MASDEAKLRAVREAQEIREADADITTVMRLIEAECDAVKSLLLDKNRRYGNSALDPVRIFSRASSREQILVRIDDKLSRVARGARFDQSDHDDVVMDLIGYLILLRVAGELEGE